jgi:hypothetical protein
MVKIEPVLDAGRTRGCVSAGKCRNGIGYRCINARVSIEGQVPERSTRREKNGKRKKKKKKTSRVCGDGATCVLPKVRQEIDDVGMGQ